MPTFKGRTGQTYSTPPRCGHVGQGRAKGKKCVRPRGHKGAHNYKTAADIMRRK